MSYHHTFFAALQMSRSPPWPLTPRAARRLRARRAAQKPDREHDRPQARPRPRSASPTRRDRDAVPVYVEADRIEGRSRDRRRGRGNVHLRQRGQAVCADWLRYTERPTTRSTPRQRAHRAAGRPAHGRKLAYNLESDTRRHGAPALQRSQRDRRPRRAAERLVSRGPGKLKSATTRITPRAPSAATTGS